MSQVGAVGGTVEGDTANRADDPAALAATVLAEEAKRQAEQAERSAEIVLPDDLLPGVGADELRLLDTLRQGGWSMIVVVILVVVVEQVTREATGVLGPDLQNTFNLSDTKLIAIAAFGGIAIVLGAVPMAWLADRVSRKRIVVFSGLAASLALVLIGVAANTFQLFWGFVAFGLAAAYSNPVFGSLLSDQYPIEGRGRIFSLYAVATPLGLTIGPFIAGTIADIAGGPEGWRWSYIGIAIPVALLAIGAGIFLDDPPRGQFEQEFVLGEVLDSQPGQEELPITISTAYQRMKKIRTFHYIAMGIGVLGLALITVPIQLSLLLRDDYGYDAFTRGWVLSLAQIPGVIAIFGAGVLYDRTFRSNPERVVRIAGSFIIVFGALLVLALRFEPIWMLMGIFALASACTSAALVGVGPIVASVAPYRLRSQAFAIIPVFTFLMGGFVGGLLAGALSDAHGQRTALTIVVPISALAGGWLFLVGSRHLKGDISRAVEELLEEQQEQERMTAAPEDIPALQVRHLDFSYGSVQVLFDVNLEVRKGEVLALLGTNGAGKSTLLRAISGLGIPDRGVVRLHGRSLTYVEAEVRFGVGVVQLRGGSGVFTDLTVKENLRAALLSSRHDPVEVERRLSNALGLFPSLESRGSHVAGDLSGGQQQMLALAMVLMHEPEVLLIDELSLGLAPVVVQELLAVVEKMRNDGMTMIIVEQSLNLALSFADRAVFMEKGRVRFEGPAEELLERDDLVRAVFLGDAKV